MDTIAKGISWHLVMIQRKDIPFIPELNRSLYFDTRIHVLLLYFGKKQKSSFLLYSILLILHITSGTTALIGMTGAIAAKVVMDHHKIHILCGRLFIIGMLMVFLTTIPMTILRPNLFLLLIGIFSFYLAWNGWRMAVNRNGKAQFLDIIGNIIMGDKILI